MLSSLRSARAGVAEFRTALGSPSLQEIERFLPLLVDVTASVGAAQASTENRAELLGELMALKNELRVVRRIVGQGSAFYLGLARLLGATMAGYTQAGESAPLTAGPTISAQG